MQNMSQYVSIYQITYWAYLNIFLAIFCILFCILFVVSCILIVIFCILFVIFCIFSCIFSGIFCKVKQIGQGQFLQCSAKLESVVSRSFNVIVQSTGGRQWQHSCSCSAAKRHWQSMLVPRHWQALLHGQHWRPPDHWQACYPAIHPSMRSYEALARYAECEDAKCAQYKKYAEYVTKWKICRICRIWKEKTLFSVQNQVPGLASSLPGKYGQDNCVVNERSLRR